MLAALRRGDSYGYQIIKDVSPAVEISESTLYPILKRLEASELVSSYSVAHEGRLRKYYHLTEPGQRRIADFAAEWREVMAVYEFITEGRMEMDKQAFLENLGGRNGVAAGERAGQNPGLLRRNDRRPMEDGMGEAEAVAAMGDAEAIVREIISECPSKSWWARGYGKIGRASQSLAVDRSGGDRLARLAAATRHAFLRRAGRLSVRLDRDPVAFHHPGRLGRRRIGGLVGGIYGIFAYSPPSGLFTVGGALICAALRCFSINRFYGWPGSSSGSRMACLQNKMPVCQARGEITMKKIYWTAAILLVLGIAACAVIWSYFNFDLRDMAAAGGDYTVRTYDAPGSLDVIASDKNTAIDVIPSADGGIHVTLYENDDNGTK